MSGERRGGNASHYGISEAHMNLPPNTNYTAWYLKEAYTNRYEPNFTDPPEFITDAQIYQETEGFFGWFDFGDTTEQKEYEKKCMAIRNMPYIIPVEADIEQLGDKFDEKADIPWHHHIHPGECMRVCIEGSGYVDIEDVNRRWIRRPVERGNWWVLPNGCYHRLTFDGNKKMKVLMCHYEKKAASYLHYPEGDKSELYTHYVERMKSLRRANLFHYLSVPGCLDVVPTLSGTSHP